MYLLHDRKRLHLDGKCVLGFFCVLRVNMEVQIHILEQEAYCAVLRAFKAQSDAISWVS